MFTEAQLRRDTTSRSWQDRLQMTGVNLVSSQLVFRPDTFWKSVNEDVRRAQEIARRFEEFAFARDDSAYNEEEDFLEREFRWIVERLKQQILLATDVLGASAFREDFRANWSSVGDVLSMEMLPWVGVLTNPALDRLGWALQALQAWIPEPNANEFATLTDLARLEQMLEGTPKLIHDRKIQPCNEAEIKREMYALLLHWFPDTVREIPIAQVSKTYKPDLGVRSLKAAIEYKFANSEAELKRMLGEIYADIHGYGGSADWIKFYAVIYMTDPFMTRHQVEAEWQMTGVPSSWKCVLVNGNGQRRNRRARSESRKRAED